MSSPHPQASTSSSNYTSNAPLAAAPLDPLTASSVPILHALPSNIAVYRCATCSAELTVQDELVSRAFSGGTGPAYLVRTTINTYMGPKATKQLLTGKHVVSPLYCKGCQTELGWTYVRTRVSKMLSKFELLMIKSPDLALLQHVAPDGTQKYKEHKSILEKTRIYKDNKWST